MSASPAPSEQMEESKKIAFRFCQECSNLLAPKEDKENNVLLYECQTCHWNEAAPTSCVYRDDLDKTVGETAGITQDIANDPTVSDLFCTMCGEVITEDGRKVPFMSDEQPKL